MSNPHARGVHQTGWTDDAPTVIELGMAHVEPTYALGAHVQPKESMTLYATYTATVASRQNSDFIYAATKTVSFTVQKAPVNATSMYRLYNPNAGDHHYTTSASEQRWLVSLGWIGGGISWYGLAV